MGKSTDFAYHCMHVDFVRNLSEMFSVLSIEFFYLKNDVVRCILPSEAEAEINEILKEPVNILGMYVECIFTEIIGKKFVVDVLELDFLWTIEDGKFTLVEDSKTPDMIIEFLLQNEYTYTEDLEDLFPYIFVHSYNGQQLSEKARKELYRNFEKISNKMNELFTKDLVNAVVDIIVKSYKNKL